jgi:hypothetical protein
VTLSVVLPTFVELRERKNAKGGAHRFYGIIGARPPPAVIRTPHDRFLSLAAKLMA